jgi:two-component system cell cycle sensor histidine kinase/response regulator CckA
MRWGSLGGRGWWFPLAIAGAVLGVVLLVYASVRGAERDHLAFRAGVNATGAAADVQAGMESLFATFTRVARQHGYTKLRGEGTWSLDLTSLKGSAWIEPSGAVGAVQPGEGNEDLRAFGTSEADRAALAAAQSTGKPTATTSIFLADGDPVIHVVVPVLEAGEIVGFVVGSFSGRRLYEATLPPGRSSDWAVGVFESGRELHRNGDAIEGWRAEAPMTVLGVARTVRAGATARALQRRRRSLPAIVLVGGTVMALLVGASAALAQSARRRALEAEAAGEALRVSEEQYRLLFEGNPSPMWVYDESTLQFLAVNEAAIRHYGYSRDEFLGMTIRDIRPPETVPQLEDTLARRRSERGQSPLRQTWKHVKKDGTVIEVEVTGRPIRFEGRSGWLTLASDVTERNRLSGQLQQAQKMESVGRLAGGIAHDFNNLLGVIIGYGELLRRDLGGRAPAADRLEEILKAADRASVLTRQLLAFSRKQILAPTVLDLNGVVSEIETMLRRLIGEDIELITAVGTEPELVKADRGQLEQVIVNLAVNARDAMPRGGKLILETASVDLDEAYAATRPDARAGPHVMLAISDTGHGMDAATLSSIFEPFFTTKEQGKGTGLGLAMVHGIVRQSGGHVTVYSEVGRGTTFKVYIPRYQGEGAPAAAEAAPAASGGDETILLVEDEPSLRKMIAELLASNGYEVLIAGTLDEALAAADAHHGPLGLILTDVILPGRSGREIAEAVRAARPEAAVLFTSGYTDDAISHQGVLEAGVHFLAKPFMTDQLLRKVREVLDAPSPPATVS